jgi:hypothetical protein
MNILTNCHGRGNPNLRTAGLHEASEAAVVDDAGWA